MTYKTTDAINNITRDMTPEETAEHERFLEIAKKAKEADAKELADKKSGHQKLIDLGLTEDEAFAISGYQEPVAGKFDNE